MSSGQWILISRQQMAAISQRLTHLDGQKLDKLSLGTEAQAIAAQQRIEAANWQVSAIETKRVKRRPSPPFDINSATGRHHVNLDFLPAGQCKLRRNYMKALIWVMKQPD